MTATLRPPGLSGASRARGSPSLRVMPNDVKGSFAPFRFPADTPWMIADGSSNVKQFRWLPADGSTPDLGLPREFSGAAAIWGYVGGDGVLETEFLGGGRTYQYFPVPFDEYLSMVAAPSRGKHVYWVIRQKGYPYIRTV